MSTSHNNMVKTDSKSFIYEANPDGGVTIIKYFGEIVDIKIPDQIDGMPVTVIDEMAFKGCETLKSVVVSINVRYIGKNAFWFCSNLTNVTIPAGVNDLGFGAFRCCEQLESVILPESMNSIGSAAFLNCNNLKSVTIPNGIKCIEEYTFERCESLTSLTVPTSVTRIGKEAFSHCKCLTKVTIPYSINNIGDNAFDGCEQLKEVFFGGSKTQWLSIVGLMLLDSVNRIGIRKNTIIHYNCDSRPEVKAEGTINDLIKNKLAGGIEVLLGYTGKTAGKTIKDKQGPIGSLINKKLGVDPIQDAIDDFEWLIKDGEEKIGQ